MFVDSFIEHRVSVRFVYNFSNLLARDLLAIVPL